MNEFAYSLLLMAADYLQLAEVYRDGLFTEEELQSGIGFAGMRICNDADEARLKELEGLAAVYMDFYFKVMGID